MERKHATHSAPFNVVLGLEATLPTCATMQVVLAVRMLMDLVVDLVAGAGLALLHLSSPWVEGKTPKTEPFRVSLAMLMTRLSHAWYMRAIR